MIALGLWKILQASGSDLSHFSAGWIALVVGCNAVLAAGVYGAWHYRLYVRRAQGIQFKYNPSWPKERSDKFLFGRPTASNVFWTLGSGVPIWSAYLVVTLWAQATGIAPVTSWAASPVYCALLMFALPFFHAVHFYVVHRAIHWPPLYNTVHYLHHANNNPGPWSGLAMHPVEHLIYFSGVLLLWVVPSTPIHAIYFVTFVGLAPVEGHSGFGKIVLGRYRLHQRRLLSLPASQVLFGEFWRYAADSARPAVRHVPRRDSKSSGDQAHRLTGQARSGRWRANEQGGRK